MDYHWTERMEEWERLRDLTLGEASTVELSEEVNPAEWAAELIEEERNRRNRQRSTQQESQGRDQTVRCLIDSEQTVKYLELKKKTSLIRSNDEGDGLLLTIPHEATMEVVPWPEDWSLDYVEPTADTTRLRIWKTVGANDSVATESEREEDIRLTRKRKASAHESREEDRSRVQDGRLPKTKGWTDGRRVTSGTRWHGICAFHNIRGGCSKGRNCPFKHL